jgi:hypothetical protein
MAGELITEGIEEDIKLQPFIAPINHITLTSAKTVKIVHTLMGNYCHGDKDKISQMENMGFSIVNGKTHCASNAAHDSFVILRD